jgi:PAS domain S-box-containing protein
MRPTDLERRRPRDVSDAFSYLIEAAPDAIVIVDAAGTIELINGEAERLFGYDRDELLGRPLEILVPERFRPQHESELARYFTAPRARPMGIGLDLWARRRDGTQVPVEISLTPIETDEGVFVSAAIRDVTSGIALAQRIMHLLGPLDGDATKLLGDEGSSRPDVPHLTARELELVALAAQGLSARDMSEQLNLSESTVKSHFTSVYRKLGVSDRAAAVAQAIRRGLIR